MTLNDPLANVFSNILNSEKVGKTEVVIAPSSKLIKQILTLLQDKHYLGGFEEIKDGKGNILVMKLIGAVNNCGVIKPRYSVKLDNYTKYEKRFLPAKGFGILMVSTPKGLMTHEEANEQQLGGRLIAYCY
ncbi:30S ribosomal protein S8 [Candidatus Woesearchaeota archaeon]|nr:30S ribosomal protein S8 [Candidatus Woesearchaeota archaeon]